MKYFREVAIVLGICLAGECIAALLPFAVPSSILSMALLLGLFYTPVLKPEKIEHFANLMLSNMALFFIPAGVQILKYLAEIKAYWPQILFICITSLLLTFAVTGWTVTLVMRLMAKKEK